MSVLDKWLRSPSISERTNYHRPSSSPRKTIAQAAAASAANRAKQLEEDTKPSSISPSSPGAIDPAIQKKLDRYFARLRTIYPDGVIVRLNTGQKKLAERGSQLRHALNWDQDLDSFFALGGFTYQRSESGRPPTLKGEEDVHDLVQDIRKEFPDGVPSVAAVQKADHRLYLNLRSAARKEECTMTEFMKKYNVYILKESA